MEVSIPIVVKLMSKQVQVDKPWLGPISWEPISSLLTFFMTAENAIKDAEDNCAVFTKPVIMRLSSRIFPWNL